MRGRNATTLNTELSVFFVDAGFVGMTTSAAGANAQEREADLTGPLEALRPGITENQIFSELRAPITSFRVKRCSSTQSGEPIK